MSKKIKHRHSRSAGRKNARANSSTRARKRRQRRARLPHGAYITDLAFELPWPDQSPSQLGARHKAFKTAAQDVNAFQLVAYDVRALVNSLNYLVLLPYWPRRGAEALVRLGHMEHASTHGITVELNLERGWQEDVEFLINSLSTIVGPEFLSMRANAQVIRFVPNMDIAGCHVRRCIASN